MPARIRSDDEVVVLSGKDRGKRGKVLRVDRKHERVYVQGLNLVKRHQKASQAGTVNPQPGGVIEKEAPIHLSNVALLDPDDSRPTRVRVELIDGQRVRVAHRSGKRFD